MRISDWSSDVCSSDLGLRTELLDVLAQRCRRISLACTQARFGAVWIAYPRPSRLGVDRFLALLGAHARGVGATMVDRKSTRLTPVTNAHLVCRLLLEKNKTNVSNIDIQTNTHISNEHNS